MCAIGLLVGGALGTAIGRAEWIAAGELIGLDVGIVAGAQRKTLLQRIAALEARVAELVARSGPTARPAAGSDVRVTQWRCRAVASACCI